MTQVDWENQLKRDGYSSVTLHKDPAHFFYPDHFHPVDTAYVALQGDMVVKMEGKSYSIKNGERLDIGKNVVHDTRVGKDGCSFLVGVKV